MKRIVWIVFGCSALTTTVQAASFDCAKAASATEKLICGDDELSKLDEVLSKSYQQLVEKNGDKQKVIREQRLWLKNERNSCQDVDCLKAAYRQQIARLDAKSVDADKSDSGSAISSDTSICEHFQDEHLELMSSNQIPGVTGAKVLCIDKCESNEVRASKFWGKPDVMERAIYDYAVRLQWARTDVTEIDINGDGKKEVRLSRIVGTAYCRDDAYLMRTNNGYKLIESPSLNIFSEEAGHCGAGDIFFSTYKGISYAIDTYFNELTAYKVDKQYNLTKVCSVKSSDSFEYGEKGLISPTELIEQVVQDSDEYGDSKCKLVGKPIFLAKHQKYFLVTTDDDCDAEITSWGRTIAPVWIVKESVTPEIVLSSKASSIYLIGDVYNGVHSLAVNLDKFEGGTWQFNGSKFVTKFAPSSPHQSPKTE